MLADFAGLGRDFFFSAWFWWEYFRRKRYFQHIENILEKADKRFLLGELMPDSYRLEDNLYRNYIRQSEYFRRKRYFQHIENILEKADKRFLLGELMPDSYRLEDNLYRNYIRQSNKSVIEHLRKIEDEQKEYREYIESWVHEIKAPITSVALACKIEDEQKEYREYIESWVHEIKAPITSVALACENHKNVVTRNISRENQKIENYVEMALYYARLGQVYQDYQIQEMDLAEVVREVLVRNKYYFIQNKVQAEVNCPHKVSTDKKWLLFILNQIVLNSVKYRKDLVRNKYYFIQNKVQAEVNCPHKVSTDKKWLLFILNQIVLNSVKYRKEEGAKIWIYTISDDEGISLIVRDNGVGIPKAEQKKIFEKGFTGSNGRTHERSTGMGLYLCRKLCGKLGLEIHAKSQEAEQKKIFEKGFTGSNGRTHERSTGMGLYLCRKLCGKLGLEIHAKSQEGSGTELMISFPVSSYLSKL